ncbi:MAG: sensor histidine kinase [Coriobacteriia bacterium]
MTDRLHIGMPSYRMRVLAAVSTAVVLLAVAWVWSLYGPLSDAVLERETVYLTGAARSAALAVDHPDAALQEMVKRLGADTGVRITVVGNNGVVLADSDEVPSTLENHGDRPEVVGALAGAASSDIRESDTQGVDRLYVAVPAVLDGANVAVRASTPLAFIADVTGRLRTTGFWFLAVALAIALAFAWRISEAAGGPVDRLADAARAMAAGDLNSPVPATRGALAPLGEALDSLGQQMRDRITTLELERESLRLAVDGLSDAVLLLDGGRIEVVNREAALLMRAGSVGLEGRDLDAAGLPASLAAAIDAHLGDDQPATIDLGPDPYQRYHRLRTVPLGRGAHGRRTLAVITDTTERMRLDAVRTDFVANASHELKTPSAGILLLAESADDAARDGDLTQALEFVLQIRGEAQRLTRLVADLLDLSRMERVAAPGAIADVRRSIDLACSAHRRAATARGLALTQDLSSVAGQDIAVAMEQADLAIVLDNLLSNAIAYSEAGEVGVAVAADDFEVRITVRDTGIGIPEADLERVFERFYRVDRGRSRVSGGTGLGLALVRNATERAHGTVSIESGQGTGTAITVRLPRVR